MARLVRFRVIQGIAVVTLDAAPVNALSAPLRAGLWEVFSRIDRNPEIKAAVLMAAGRMFSAGADIREFNKPARDPSLAQLCGYVEACSKPVVAAFRGQALGGGAELLLAAHYRLASPDARFTFPEVSLGLVPGAGGTQRLPRLIGAEHALHLMISTESIAAEAAHRVGLVDEIVQGDLGSGGMAFAKNLVAREKGPKRTRDNRESFKDGRAYAATIAKIRNSLKDNPRNAPDRIIECVEVAALLPFDAGLAFEADAFARCLEHPQSIALRHVFMAERKVDNALIENVGGVFRPVVPMGKAVEERLRKAMRKAAEYLVENGSSEAEIDGAMVAYGFRRGPFGGGTKTMSNRGVERRLIAALLVEGAACVYEGAVQRPSDIDALAVHALRFPRRKGGPMRAAQTAGLIELRKDMRVWAQDSDIWAVPSLLDEAIKDSHGFDAVA